MLKLWITKLNTSQGEDDYSHEELENPTYQQVVQALDNFNWQIEAQNLEEQGECGGIMFTREEGEAKIELEFHPEAQGGMLMAHLRCKRGFLGFGRQSCSKDFMEMKWDEIKMILHDFYNLPCESLYQRYAQ